MSSPCYCRVLIVVNRQSTFKSILCTFFRCSSIWNSTCHPGFYPFPKNEYLTCLSKISDNSFHFYHLSQQSVPQNLTVWYGMILGRLCSTYNIFKEGYLAWYLTMQGQLRDGAWPKYYLQPTAERLHIWVIRWFLLTGWTLIWLAGVGESRARAIWMGLSINRSKRQHVEMLSGIYENTQLTHDEVDCHF